MTAIVHVVLVKWRDDVPAADRERIARDARAMADAIPGILALEEGPSVSPEGLEQGFEWGLVVTFESPEARDGYLPHPVHAAVGKRIGAGAERLVVFDVAADRVG
ncbi:Dabb family protein [Naasia sp. SYSU D00057]|uniref:Dabb family protein n=1 Tax=Naasia sp. SYSU D00057 TaxID=2817380 RepID=UPI001B30905B|nr:Dabb family protein [Naasia sp. SYSU D00057]